jgi:ribosomal protein L16 Arg81 hydroxylase
MQPAGANLALAAQADRDTERSVAPSHFYQTASLQSLVSPVSEEEFRARYWERKPLIVHRGNPDYYGDLFTLQDFDDSIRGGRGYVKTAEATSKKQAKHHGTGAEATERVLTDMRDGHTLILDGVQEFEPKLGQACRLLAQDTGARFQTNIYLTPPKGKGFTPHWDNHDVFVLQVLGSKNWKVEKERRTLPARDGVIEEGARDFRGELYEFTLQQGDMVYIPRGFVHAAECGSDISTHVTLGMYPNAWDELLIATIKAAVMRDDSLRLALPFGHMKGDAAGIVNRVAEVMRSAADPAFITQALELYRNDVVKKASLDISGQIASFYLARDLKPEDRMGRRPGLFYTLNRGPETVTINVGTRAITFPDFFGEALEFALTTPAFAIRDLPGDLEDDEKVVFVERLIQEALLVRQ